MALRSAGPEPSQSPTIPHVEPAKGTDVLELAQQRPASRVRRILKVLGPGLITGASDDDPSGIGTYAVAGASLGYSMLWTAPWSFPLMAAVQFICAKVGMVSGRGLAGVLRQHYPRWLLYPAVLLLVIANTINAGADIGAIAAAINMLVPMLPITGLIVPIALLVLGLQVWGSYRLIARTFKWLTLALLAYVAAGLFVHPDVGEVVRNTLIPHFSFDATSLTSLVAILGTTISPYLFFWQSSQEVEEEVEMGRTRVWQRLGATDSELKYRAWDVNTGMFFAIVVMYFIMLSTGATLHQTGHTDINTAAEAAVALEPMAGQAAGLLLALGLVGTGFLAVPILTGSAAYAVSEAFGWRFGLNQNPARAKQFYAIIVIATLLGMLINFVGINPIDALFWTAVINGFMAPPLLVLIMVIANNRTIMGRRVNGVWTNLLGGAATLAMSAAAVILVVNWLRG
jgi:NRAMP (natural resistance-associated macrophage protein)-like metal ion transporter